MVDLDAFGLKLSTESDRACVVLGAALLDAELGKLIHSRLACLQSDLLTPGRPLGSFSTRLKVSRSLNWIDESTYRDLEAIREMRNGFAHSSDHNLSFASQSVKDTCLSLRAAQLFRTCFDGASGGGLTPAAFAAMKSVFASPRKSFEVSVEIIFQLLVKRRSAVLPYVGPELCQQVQQMFDELKFYSAAE